MPTYCIICGKQRQGLPVANDHILDALRWFKRNVTKNEQKNRLIVCKEDYPVYKKNLDRYNSRRLLYVGLGVAFLIVGLILSFTIGTLVVGLAVVVFLFLMSLLNYTPSLEIEKAQDTSKKHKHNQ